MRKVNAGIQLMMLMPLSPLIPSQLALVDCSVKIANPPDSIFHNTVDCGFCFKLSLSLCFHGCCYFVDVVHQYDHSKKICEQGKEEQPHLALMGYD